MAGWLDGYLDMYGLDVGESEEIPYTRFDLQEFFDPDMEAAVGGRCLEDISVTNML